MNSEAKASEEERLQRNLAILMSISAATDPGQISTEVKMRLAAEGYDVLMGRTPPLLELLIWGDEQTEVRNVPLPEGEYQMTV